MRQCAFSFFLTAAVGGWRTQNADAAKEKNLKRRGAAPPLKVPLFGNLSSLSPPRPRCAAHRLRCACSLTALPSPRCAACGVLAYFRSGGEFCVNVSSFVMLKNGSLPEGAVSEAD